MNIKELQKAPEANLNQIQLGCINVLHRQRELGKLDEVKDWKDILLLKILDHYAPHVFTMAKNSPN